ncbi:ATP-binding protein [Streptomyces sp. NPDC014882]|uniref:ATP-binding protein n=1 Tax=Streptomyces sp. NPDC014882 TaxID=3364927 RepID=UPI00370101B2
MPLPAPHRQRRSAEPSPASSAVPVTVLLLSAAAAGAAVALAPSAARTWTVVTAVAAWCCVAAAVLVCGLLLRRVRRTAAATDAEVARLTAQSAQRSAESAHLVNVTVPALVSRLREGARAKDALEQVTLPADVQLRRTVEAFSSAVEQVVQYAAATDAERLRAREELAQVTEEVAQVTRTVLPDVVGQLREGNSADTVLAGWEWPPSSLLRSPVEAFVRELARSERRAAAAQAASAKALSRVQAKTVSMLADLREMQERHGEEVFGDLLKLDHGTSQLGLMTDRLALLMGGRSSRAWNKPIVMESILRGAAGRIAAYQRVRLHCSTSAAISGFAAEGVMHLIAELMDNAANFSPPIDEVHVYVDEHSAGLVVTIEDSGLKMSDAAMRHAEEAVAGHMTDLASLPGTRLGLAVVGGLAVKYGISVNYRPSSRGGTGVVVLLPRQLLAQRRDTAPQETAHRPAVATTAPETARATAGTAQPTTGGVSMPGEESVPGGVPGTSGVPGTGGVPAPAVRPAAAPPAAPAPAPAAASTPAATPAAAPASPSSEVRGRDASRRPVAATPNGLPVRAPGRTMAEAEQERQQRRTAADSPAPGGAPGQTPPGARDAGTRFGAFHSGRTSAGEAGPSGTGTAPEPPAAR